MKKQDFMKRLVDLKSGNKVEALVLFVVRPGMSGPAKVERWMVKDITINKVYATVVHLDDTREKPHQSEVFATFDDAAAWAKIYNQKLEAKLNYQLTELKTAQQSLVKRLVQPVEKRPYPPLSDDDLANLLYEVD